MPNRTGCMTAVAGAVAALMVVGVAACGGDTDDRLPPPQSPAPTQPEPSPTLDLTPAEQEALDEVRALFDEFMAAYVEVATSGLMPHDHEHHAFLDQHRLYDGGHLRELFEMWQDSQVFQGDLHWTYLEVERLEIDHVSTAGNLNPQVWLRYCVDATDWVKIDQTTGDPVEEPGERMIWMVPAGYLSDEDAGGFGGWRLGWRTEESAC